jgi:hypothetical protein
MDKLSLIGSFIPFALLTLLSAFFYNKSLDESILIKRCLYSFLHLSFFVFAVWFLQEVFLLPNKETMPYLLSLIPSFHLSLLITTLFLVPSAWLLMANKKTII